MKKFCFLALVVCATLSAQSQEGEFQFGVFGGASISNLASSEEVVSTNTRFGFNGGVFGNYFLSDQWSIKGTAHYNQNGWVLDESVSSATQTGRTLTLHYITVTPAAQFNFGPDANWQISLGPYMSFLVGANQGTAQVKDSFKKTDFGLTGSFGYRFDLSQNLGLLIEFVQQLGLADIPEENEGDAIKNTRSSINFGLIF